MATQTIKVKNFSDIFMERTANAAITPGHVCELMSSNEVRVCATAGSSWAGLVALEDALQGKDINANYAANDKVQLWVACRGDVVNMLLEDEQTIVIGDSIEVATGGRVRKYTNGVKIGIALEAVDLSTLPEGSDSSEGGAYYNPRIKVQII